MAPKSRGKAKGKGKGAPDPDAPLNVPVPPLEPVCLPLPEILAAKHASDRCLLLGLPEAAQPCKLQQRPFQPGEASEKVAQDRPWTDIVDKVRVDVPNNGGLETWLVHCESVRLQYRYVLEKQPPPIDGVSVANWASAPSEPVASCVDQPRELEGELCYDSDVAQPSVLLMWRSSNMEPLKRLLIDGSQTGEFGPFAAYPGMLPTKVQVRWRSVRTLSGSDGLPQSIKNGRYHTSPAIDNPSMDAGFDSLMQVWKMPYREVVHGVVACFQIRVGTTYRWSPWSEESNEVRVEVPEPTPIGTIARNDAGKDATDVQTRNTQCIKVLNLTDRDAEVVWPPFVAQGLLTWIEYRLSLCPLERFDEIPPWEDRGFAVSTMVLQKSSEQVSSVIRGLHPNTWYIVRVDARYPHVGKRSFSTCKALSPPFLAPFLPRPPLQPMPYTKEEAEEDSVAQAVGSSQGVGSAPAVEVLGGDASVGAEGEGSIDWATSRWLALRVESGCLDEYDIEYKEAGAARRDVGHEYYEDWLKPARVEVLPGPLQVSGTEAQPEVTFQCVRIFFNEEETPEVVVCRLVHKKPIAAISPLQWVVVTTPLVPYIAAPSFQSRAMWAHVTNEGLRIAMQVLLQPRETAANEHAAHLAPERQAGSGPGRSVTIFGGLDTSFAYKLGHRFATRYQIRMRLASDTPDPWTCMDPALLPLARPVPTGAHSVRMSANAKTLSQMPEHLVAVLGLLGERYELDIDAGTEFFASALRSGAPFDLEVRVGNDHRWSAWKSPGQDVGQSKPITLTIPTPTPMEDSNIDVAILSATRLKLSWPPFNRLPGITRLEYLVRAVPTLIDDNKETRREGYEAIQHVISAMHKSRKTDEEILHDFDVHRQQADLDAGRVDAMTVLSAARAQELEEDRLPDNCVEVEFVGLLPCTQYTMYISACYPSASSVVAAAPVDSADGVESSEQLSICIETPGGEVAPAAPQPVAPSDEPAEVTPDARGAFLCVEDRPGYLLEYRAAGAEHARFGVQKSQPASTFGGSWQVGAAVWRRVQAMQVLCEADSATGCDAGGGEGYRRQIVWAELPNFSGSNKTTSASGTGAGNHDGLSSRGGEAAPDAVQFRFCAAARSAAHPCRWVGGISEPVATCFAPPRRMPKVRRVLSDDRWSLSLTLEVFKIAPAPCPPKLLATFGNNDDDDSEDEDDDREYADFPRVEQQQSWSVSTVGRVPVGYGHRMATLVQIRHALQTNSVMSTQWQTDQPLPVKSTHIEGSQCTLELDSGVGLLDGGIYVFQARVGDGCRWSTWSHTSHPFAVRVPPPMPPTAETLGAQQPVTVEVVSSHVARVRWCDLRPAPGLTLLEYEVCATPRQSGSSQQKSDGTIAITFEHRYRGGWIEREVQNLVPFTPYIFSVRARYPRVGNRGWTGEQCSQPVSLEHPTAAQDPPAPSPVANTEDETAASSDNEIEGAGTESKAVRSALLEFLDEEDGSHYDLEYAHVLGSEQDTSELRTNQQLWLSPQEVVMVDVPASAGSMLEAQLPRWSVRLSDIRPFRSDSLKLVVLQRVCFRLRARYSADTPTTRWWSSISVPVCTGFAAPESAMTSLVVAGDRLALEFSFSLDLRLASEAAAAGHAKLQAQSIELLQALQVAEHSANADEPRIRASAMKQPLWPRGFGHPFVTRYQLRVRWRRTAAEDGSDVQEWSGWEFQPDSSLPQEVDRSVTSSTYMQTYVSEVPLSRPQALQTGDLVQVSVRIGDCVKWSVWLDTPEVAVVLPPPRAVRERDAQLASAQWVGDTCVVQWPGVMAPAGVDSIEYQLMAIPDSTRIGKHIGAVLVHRAAVNFRLDTCTFLEGGDRPVSRARPGSRARFDASFVDTPSSTGKSPRLRGSMHSGSLQMVSVELHDLCRDVRHSFAVLARYPTVGPRTFTPIFEIPAVSWKPGAGQAHGGSSAMLCHPPPPMPEQVSAVTHSQHDEWHARRFVSLTWTGLERGMRDLEVQACAADSSLRNAELDDGSPDVADEAAKTCSSWITCASTSHLEAGGQPCVTACDLPFVRGCFRLYDRARELPGPMSKPMVTIFDSAPETPTAEMQALGRGAPRTLAVRIEVPQNSEQRPTHCQVRFRSLPSRFSEEGVTPAEDQWQELEPAAFGAAGSAEKISIFVREEDGLELGLSYEFAARLGDRCRLGHWSKASRPVRFVVPPPIPGADVSIHTVVEAEAVHLTWAPFQPATSLVLRMPGFKDLPIEYIVSVYSGKACEPVTTFVTDKTKATVMALSPGTSYSVALSARWTRFGGDGQAALEAANGERNLSATFVTAPPRRHLAVEVSMRHPCSDAAPAAEAFFCVDGTGPTPESPLTATLNLEPNFARVQPLHLPHAYMRKVAPPRNRSWPKQIFKPLKADGADPGALAPVEAQTTAQVAAQPSVVLPVLPPKFVVRHDSVASARVKPERPRSGSRRVYPPLTAR